MSSSSSGGGGSGGSFKPRDEWYLWQALVEAKNSGFQKNDAANASKHGTRRQIGVRQNDAALWKSRSDSISCNQWNTKQASNRSQLPLFKRRRFVKNTQGKPWMDFQKLYWIAEIVSPPSFLFFKQLSINERSHLAGQWQLDQAFNLTRQK